MRRIAVVMQTTLNNRIAKAFGVFWEPFPWGEPEQAWLNSVFRLAASWHALLWRAFCLVCGR